MKQSRFISAAVLIFVCLIMCGCKSPSDHLAEIVSKEFSRDKDKDGEGGEYVILYRKKEQPIDLKGIAKILTAKTKYKCEIQEDKSTPKARAIPTVRVETALPLAISLWDKFEGLDFYYEDKELSPDEVAFIKTCTDGIVVAGAAGGRIERFPGGAVGIGNKYAPKAEDTREVVRTLVSEVDGIARCNTDGYWIHRKHETSKATKLQEHERE